MGNSSDYKRRLHSMISFSSPKKPRLSADPPDFPSSSIFFLLRSRTPLLEPFERRRKELRQTPFPARFPKLSPLLLRKRKEKEKEKDKDKDKEALSVETPWEALIHSQTRARNPNLFSIREATPLEDALELEEYRRRVRSLENQAGTSSDRSAGGDGRAPLNPNNPNNLSFAVSVYLDSTLAHESVSGKGQNAIAVAAATTTTNTIPVWKKLYSKVQAKESHRNSITADINLYSSRLAALQITRKENFAKADTKLSAVFTPLSKEEEEEVTDALNDGNRQEVLVFHKNSNIEINRITMQCLRPGKWLNDEVVNLYMELFKEREHRDPKKFLKCHFFNTFFYNKLFKDKLNYDFKAVRRWTTQRKIGYALHECDKIFVPIHKDIHWCLGIINIQEKKLEYLDSLKGRDKHALQILANYLVDEAKDKAGKEIDLSSWERSFPENIPEQLNGCDCGVFMVKYIDFHSRGVPLKFSQDDMEYFRRRMVHELLNLNAR